MGAFATTNSFAACQSNQYTGYDGYCKPCPAVWNSNSQASANYDAGIVAPLTCGSGTYTCPAWSYRMKGYDGKYKCATCPKIDNKDTFGVGIEGDSSIPYKLVLPYHDWTTWSSSYRCRGTTKIAKKKADGNGAYYTVTFEPDPNDCDSRYFCSSGEDCTDWSNNIAAGTGCNYKIVSKKYRDAPAGYYIQNDDTASAASVKCPVGTFKSGTDAVTVCNNCPIYMPSKNPNTWVDGTTSGMGSTSVTSCYMPGTGMGSVDDNIGTFVYSGNCYGTVYNSFLGYRIKAQFDSNSELNDWKNYCRSTVESFVNDYLHMDDEPRGRKTDEIIDALENGYYDILPYTTSNNEDTDESWMRVFMQYMAPVNFWPSSQAPSCVDNITIEILD